VDISTIRAEKIKNILQNVNSEEITLNLNGICARELEQIRPFLIETFDNKLEFLNIRQIEEDGTQPDFSNTNNMTGTNSHYGNQSYNY
jgi:hypothetical protein